MVVRCTKCTKNRSPFYFTVVSTVLTDFHNIWRNLQQQLLTCPPHLRTVATLPWEILLFWFLDHFGWFVPSTKLFNDFKTWRWNLTNERLLLLHTTMMLSWMLVQEMLRPLVPLLRCWHLSARQCARHQTIELLKRETPKFTGPGLWPPVRHIFMLYL